jgi:hypothetical protein
VLEFAVDFDWMGATGQGLWPLLLAAVGVGLVIVAVGRGEWRRGRREASHE